MKVSPIPFLKATACLAAMLLFNGTGQATPTVHNPVVYTLTNGLGYSHNAGGTLDFDVRSILSTYVNPKITAVSYSAGITDDGSDLSYSVQHTAYAYQYSTGGGVRGSINVWERNAAYLYFNESEALHLQTEGGESASASTSYYYQALGTMFHRSHDAIHNFVNGGNDDNHFFTVHYRYDEQGYRGDAIVQAQMRDADIESTFADGYVQFQIQVENDAIFTGGSLTFTIEEAAVVVDPGNNGVAAPGTLLLAGLAGVVGFTRRRAQTRPTL